MNILIVHNKYRIPSGEDSVFNNETKMLLEKGHNVFTYVLSNVSISKLNPFSTILLFFRTIYSNKQKKKIRKMVADLKIDVVHFHNTFPLLSPSVYKGASLGGAAVVQTVHNFRFLCPKGDFYRNGKVCEDCKNGVYKYALKHKCYRNSFFQTLNAVLCIKYNKRKKTYSYIDKYIFLTQFNKELFYSFDDINKMVVKPNFTEPSKEGICEPFDYFIYVGRIEENKGLDVIYQIAKLDPSLKIIVCGDGSYKEEFLKFARGVENVIYKGFVAGAELKNLWKHAVAMVFPTKWYEGMPMNVIESFSLGVPVICNEIGNLKQMVVDNENGFLIPNNLPETYCLKMNGIKNNIKLLKVLKENCLRSFNDKYTENINYNELINIYEQAIIERKNRE